MFCASFLDLEKNRLFGAGCFEEGDTLDSNGWSVQPVYLRSQQDGQSCGVYLMMYLDMSTAGVMTEQLAVFRDADIPFFRAYYAYVLDAKCGLKYARPPRTVLNASVGATEIWARLRSAARKDLPVLSSARRPVVEGARVFPVDDSSEWESETAPPAAASGGDGSGDGARAGVPAAPGNGSTPSIAATMGGSEVRTAYAKSYLCNL